MILSTSMRTSAKADLILSFTAECAVSITDTDFQSCPQGNCPNRDTDFALGVIMIWVEIDDVPVPVDLIDDGRVVFCRREANSSTFQSTGQGTDTYFDGTRNVNSFNWVAGNVGNGVHLIEVMAEVKYQSSGTSGRTWHNSFFGGFHSHPVNNPPQVEGAIGKRTLIVEPVSPQR